MRWRPQFFLTIFFGGLICLSPIYPDFFRLGPSQWYFGIVAAIIGLLGLCPWMIPGSFVHPNQDSRFMEGLTIWMLFSAIVMVQFGSIHEHIFGPDPSKGSLYDGFFTHGGYLPYSDNGYFLIGMQSFLNYGLTLSIAVFRPEGMFWSAFLYKMAGGSMILYMYLQAILSSVAVCTAAMVLRRFLSWTWVLLFTWLISRYVGLLQGTFLTELASIPFALLSFSMILYGWLERRIGLSLVGVALIALAFEMRPAVFLYAPFLFLLLGYSPRAGVSFSWKNVILSCLLYLLTVMCNRFVIQNLDHPPVNISNTYGKLYQIYMGSDAWNEANNIELAKGITDPLRVHLFRQDYVHELIRKDPMPLIKNYILGLSKVIRQPQKLFEVVDPMITTNFSIILLIFFLSGFMIHRRRRPMMLLHGLLLSYQLASLLILPFLHAELRIMSVTQPLAVLTFVMAIANAWLMAASTIRFVASVWLPQAAHFLQPDDSGNSLYHRKSLFVRGLPALSLCIVLLGILIPMLLDEMRRPIRASIGKIQQQYESVPDSGHRLFLLDLQNAPRVHFDSGHISPSLSPPQMSLDRIRKKWVLDSLPADGFVLFNAINHMNFPVQRSYSPQLIIPDHLTAGLDLTGIELMLLEVQSRELRKDNYDFRLMIAQRILDIVPQQ